MANEVDVNRYCLVENLVEAIALAERFSRDEPEPDPIILCPGCSAGTCLDSDNELLHSSIGLVYAASILSRRLAHRPNVGRRLEVNVDHSKPCRRCGSVSVKSPYTQTWA